MKRIVLDTNTVISGLLNPSNPPGKVLDLAIQGKFQLASSEHLIDELRRAMKYEKVANILFGRGWTSLDFSRFVEGFRKLCHLTSGKPLPETFCRDPDDDHLLACAQEAEAELIISGDKDVLVLEEYKGTRIIDAGSFLNEIT